MTTSITLSREDAAVVLEVMDEEPGITDYGIELRENLRRLLADPNTTEIIVTAKGKAAAELLGLGIDSLKS